MYVRHCVCLCMYVRYVGESSECMHVTEYLLCATCSFCGMMCCMPCVCVHACMHMRQRNTSIQVCYNNMYININKNIQSGNTDNNKQSLIVHILLSLLHACARASCAVVHFLSNSSGQTQKRANCRNNVTFNRFSSTCGRAG